MCTGMYALEDTCMKTGTDVCIDMCADTCMSRHVHKHGVLPSVAAPVQATPIAPRMSTRRAVLTRSIPF